MGTKGRDIVFWLFVLSITGATLLGNKSLFWIAFVFALILGCYQVFYLTWSINKSRRGNLEIVVLLPIWWPFTLLYGSFVRGYINGKWRQTYEIHITCKDPRGLVSKLEEDLLFMKDNMTGLFLWETSVPVPARFKRLIKEYSKNKKAFWIRGSWPIPKMPLSGMQIVKKHVRHGAVLHEIEKRGII